jgi:hypothetical protein
MAIHLKGQDLEYRPYLFDTQERETAGQPRGRGPSYVERDWQNHADELVAQR